MFSRQVPEFEYCHAYDTSKHSGFRKYWHWLVLGVILLIGGVSLLCALHMDATSTGPGSISEMTRLTRLREETEEAELLARKLKAELFIKAHTQQSGRAK